MSASPGALGALGGQFAGSRDPSVPGTRPSRRPSGGSESSPRPDPLGDTGRSLCPCALMGIDHLTRLHRTLEMADR